MADSDDEEASRVEEVIHSYISCDECGADRLYGIRYKSTLITDYDICQDCYQENHKNLTLKDSFAAIEEARWVEEEEYFEDPSELVVSGSGAWDTLSELLERKPKAQKVSLFLDQDADVSREKCQKVAINIAASSSLKTFFLELPPTNEEGEWNDTATQALLQGISQNLSIVTLYVGFDFSNPTMIRTVANLMRTNETVRYMFVRHRYDRSERGLQEAIQLFRALHQSSLHSFVCQGVFNLGEECLNEAIDAMRIRPGLKRIKADFRNNSVELEQLMAAKKSGWVRGWNDPLATSSDRLLILEEVLGCLRAHEQDQVAALFHFIRSNPNALPHGDDDNGL